MTKQLFIYITDTFELIHYYKDAPKEVAYLAYPHRHLAHIKVKIEVFHNDREIEFIMFKHEIRNYIWQIRTEMVSNLSCEKIAEMIVQYIQDDYGKDRDIIVEVNEDNENGCEVIYRKEK